ncbi:ArnT family glycosyltransferase [Thermodesulfobacteriota bacterium]
MFSAMSEVIPVILWLAVLAVAVPGVGFLLIRWGCIPASCRGERFVFAAGLGLGTLSYAMFCLAAFQCLHPRSVLACMGVLLCLAAVGWVRFLPNTSIRLAAHATSCQGEPWARFFLVACLVAASLTVLTPAVGTDALTYHLAVPKLFLKHHGFYFIPGNIFANYPLHAEMLFAVALSVDGDILAKGIHFTAALLVLTAMFSFTRQHLPQNRCVWLSLLIFVSVPSVYVNAHMAYSDMTATLYSFLAVYAFVNWVSDKKHCWITLSGLFSGLAISTKYTALILPLIGFAGVVWASRVHRASTGEAILSLLIYGAATLVAGCPYYLKNWFLTGNPFYPFFYEFFESRGWDPEQGRYYVHFLRSLGMGRSFRDYLLLPWNISFNARMASTRFDGAVGPVFLLTLPFLAWMRPLTVTLKILIAYSLIFFLFWASSAQQIRYLIPVFPFLAIMTGTVISAARRGKLFRSVLYVCVGASLVFSTHHIVSNFRKMKPVRFLSGQEDRRAFLGRLISSYPMFDYVNKELPDDSKIFFVYMRNLGYLCDLPYYSDSIFESYTLQKILRQSSTPDEACAELTRRGFTHVLYCEDYVLGSVSAFSAQEKARFLAFRQMCTEQIAAGPDRTILLELRANKQKGVHG